MDQFIAPVTGNPAPSVAPPKVRKDIANIFFFLDKSGSMSWLQQQSIDGFNQYVSKQLEADGITKMTLVQFNHERNISYSSLDIKQVPMLDTTSYKPGGGTALYDAIGYVLSENLALCSPDETNMIAILTDGEERDSKEYSLNDVKALLAQAEAAGWEVLFLGANMTKQDVVKAYGISASNVSAFEGTQKGVSDAFSTLSASTTSYRGLKSAGMLNERVDVEAVYAATSAGVSGVGGANLTGAAQVDFTNSKTMTFDPKDIATMIAKATASQPKSGDVK